MGIFDFLRHLFIPHYSNNQKAKLLHSSTLLGIALILLFLQVFLHFLPKAGVRVLGYASNISIDEVLRLTNQKRQEAGLSPLKLDPVLSQAAKNKGEDMLAKDYWAHVSPDGVEPWKFFIDAGYKYRYAGENLARDFSNASSAVDAWMASPSHRENMLSPKYEEIGLAVVEGDLNGVDTTIIVQFFGTRMAGGGEVSPVAQKQEQKPAVASVNVKEEKLPVPQPTQAPVSQPESTPFAFIPDQKPVVLEAGVALGESVTRTPPPRLFLISPFDFIRDVSFAILVILLFAFTIDVIIVSRKNITRVSGRTFAHISFIGMVLAIALILKAGKIL
jgi:hypothetical protein